MFSVASTSGLQLTGSYLSDLNTSHETKPDGEDEDTKSSDSQDSMHTSHNSSVDNPAFMAEQRLNRCVAVGKKKGGVGGRPWVIQGQKRRHDRRERARLHQLENNWTTGHVQVPRSVQRRLGLCVMQGGQPVEVEQTQEGASKLAELFDKMLDAAKRSCSIDVISIYFVQFSRDVVWCCFGADSGK